VSYNCTALSCEKQNNQHRNYQELQQQNQLHCDQLSSSLNQAQSILQTQRQTSLDNSKALQSELDAHKKQWSREDVKAQKKRMEVQTQLRRDITQLQKQLKDYIQQAKDGVLTDVPDTVQSILTQGFFHTHSYAIFTVPMLFIYSKTWL
jgi:hypothetical protein